MAGQLACAAAVKVIEKQINSRKSEYNLAIISPDKPKTESHRGSIAEVLFFSPLQEGLHRLMVAEDFQPPSAQQLTAGG